MRLRYRSERKTATRNSEWLKTLVSGFTWHLPGINRYPPFVFLPFQHHPADGLVLWMNQKWGKKVWIMILGLALMQRIIDEFVIPALSEYFHFQYQIDANQVKIPELHQLSLSERVLFSRALSPSFQWTRLFVINPWINFVTFGLLSTILFTNIHGPESMASFFAYFLGGLCYSYLFLPIRFVVIHR